jgi:hypothetical protein
MLALEACRLFPVEFVAVALLLAAVVLAEEWMVGEWMVEYFVHHLEAVLAREDFPCRQGLRSQKTERLVVAGPVRE